MSTSNAIILHTSSSEILGINAFDTSLPGLTHILWCVLVFGVYKSSKHTGCICDRYVSAILYNLLFVNVNGVSRLYLWLFLPSFFFLPLPVLHFFKSLESETDSLFSWDNSKSAICCSTWDNFSCIILFAEIFEEIILKTRSGILEFIM